MTIDELRRLHALAARDFDWSGGPEAAAQRESVLEATEELGAACVVLLPALLRVAEAAKACQVKTDELRDALADLEKQP